MSPTVTLEPRNIARLVLLIRGEKVILDRDLATLYGVTTKALNQAVKRNASRFPADFMFRLTKPEYDASRSQFGTKGGAASSRSHPATLKRGHNIKYLPYAFTEQGVAMLSSVLSSQRLVFAAIKELITPPEPARKQIGFHP